MTTATAANVSPAEVEQVYLGIWDAVRPVVAFDWLRRDCDDPCIPIGGRSCEWLDNVRGAARTGHGALAALADSIKWVPGNVETDLMEARITLGAIEVLAEAAEYGPLKEKAKDALFMMTLELNDRFKDVEALLNAATVDVEA